MKQGGAVLLAIAAIVSSVSVTARQSPARAPAPGEMKTTDKASPKLMTGKVTQIDAAARLFTIVAKGSEHRFTAGRGVALPKVGDVVDVGYAGDPGGPMEAINLNSSKSNVY